MTTDQAISRLLKYRDLMVDEAQSVFEQTGDVSMAVMATLDEANRADRVAKNLIASQYEGYVALPFRDDDYDWYQSLLANVAQDNL